MCPEGATNKCITWCSSNTSVATVNPTSGLVMAQGAGTAIIYATAQDGSGKQGCCKVTVEAETSTVSSIKVYQSPRLPGKAADGYSTAADMIINDKSKSQLYKMFFNSGSFCIGDLADEYDNDPQAVKDKMYELATVFCVNNDYMWYVTNKMIDHFLEGTGADFHNGTLSLYAFAHESTQRFVDKTKERIITFLQNNNGDVYAMAASDSFSEDITNNVGRPHFDTSEDLWNGLKICVNDTWGNYIEIKNYSCDGKNFSGTIRYTIYDHFGLDDDDITGDKWYLSGTIPYLYQFAAWYVLQHYTGCDKKHKPFTTYMEAEIPFSGTIC